MARRATDRVEEWTTTTASSQPVAWAAGKMQEICLFLHRQTNKQTNVNATDDAAIGRVDRSWTLNRPPFRLEAANVSNLTAKPVWCVLHALSLSLYTINLFKLHRMREMQTIVTDVRGVCLSVCLSRGACSVCEGHSVQPLPSYFGLRAKHTFTIRM